MNRTALLLAGVLSVLLAAEAGAQAPGGRAPAGRYQPSRPTVSPYLNLFRNNTGPLPNYYSLVRPQLQDIENQRRQQAINVQQQAEIRTLDRSLLQITKPNVSSTGGAGGAVFRNYSHYYPSKSQ